MANRGVYAVLVGCLSISVFTLDQPSYLINILTHMVCALNVSIGVSLLLFPVIGLLADVCFTRYRMMQSSLVILSAILALFLISDFLTEVIFSLVLKVYITILASILYVIVIVTILSSIGSQILLVCRTSAEMCERDYDNNIRAYYVWYM